MFFLWRHRGNILMMLCTRKREFLLSSWFVFLSTLKLTINPVSLLCLFTRKFRAKSVAHLLWVYSTILCIMLTSCFLSYFMFNFHDNILYTIFSLSSYLFALSYWMILCNHIVWRKARWKCIFEWNYVPKTLHYFGIWHFENGDRALSDTEPLGYKQVCCKDKLEIFL